MNKKLSEMSNEELWQLFPIILSEHHAEWSAWYREEESLLREAFKALPVKRINHVGSTAVEGLVAKPIVDIIFEKDPECGIEVFRDAAIPAGYRFIHYKDKRAMFNKGYSEQGYAEKVFHLHLRDSGDHDELYFRDYLRKFPEVACEYAALKRSLCERYRNDRDAYTESKTEFIREQTDAAKRLFGSKYDLD